MSEDRTALVDLALATWSSLNQTVVAVVYSARRERYVRAMDARHWPDWWTQDAAEAIVSMPIVWARDEKRGINVDSLSRCRRCTNLAGLRMGTRTTEG